MHNQKLQAPVSKNIRINVPPGRIWEVISKPGNLELCHPFCESNPVEKWPGINSIDYVNYYNGLEYQRYFTNWIEGIGYDLWIGRKNDKKSKVTWRINKIENDVSELEITIYPHDMDIYPNFVKRLVYLFYIRPMLRKYLTLVLKGFQMYILQDIPVQKNQFGKHRWFSN